MHEVSICESILDIVREQAAKEGATKVTSVRLKVGEMAGVVEDALRFAFEVVSKDSIAEGASLIVDNVPLTARCKSCNRTFHIIGYAFCCAHCDSPEIEIISGRELQIEDIDMEV
jgi:hydrogenase nickel incorporation protein HypA/HybF